MNSRERTHSFVPCCNCIATHSIHISAPHNMTTGLRLGGRLITELVGLTAYRTNPWTCLVASFHTDSVLCGRGRKPEYKPHKWPKYNEIVYPPTEPGDPRRPAEVTHMRNKIKYSKDKLWFLAVMIRGMSIEEAIKQMTFHKKKGGQIIKEVLLEAQEMAVKDHNVEYKNNLWIADSNTGKSMVVKGARRHARGRMAIIHYTYCHYFVRLREGSPPKHYLPPPPTGYEKMQIYLDDMRRRTIQKSL